MQIDTLHIRGKVLLAPMCDVTTLPFRLLCKRYGAAIVYTEMVNADSYIMGGAEKRATFLEEERPFGLQLAGSTVEKLVKAAKKAHDELKPDLIDINFGCPAYNVMKTGSGAAALRDLSFLDELVSSLTVVLDIPLTCKMRILPKTKDTIQAARIIEKSGAAALAVHGRTAAQKYKGTADWQIIKKIKQELSIPVILNGDIVDEDSARSALEQTGCDALMIGRAAIGNPYLFRRISHFLSTGIQLPEHTLAEKIDDFLAVYNLCKKHDYLDMKNIKMLAQNAIKGESGARKLRSNIAKAKTFSDIIILLKRAKDHFLADQK